MTLEASRAVADKLFAAQNSRTPIPPVREMLPADAIDLAYAAQEINTERRLKEGRRLVGRKIGLTSLAVQRQLGVDQPDYGMLFDDMAVPDGWDVSYGRLIQPKVEAEIAFVIGRDLDDEQADDRGHSARGRIRAAGDRDRRLAHRRLENRHSRHDRRQRVLRPLCARRQPEEARRARSAPVRHGDGAGRATTVSVGVGAACLGDPLSATLWLANTMAKVGRPLRAGDTVLSGALGPMVAVKWGEVYEARISGLGSVRAAFAKETA